MANYLILTLDPDGRVLSAYDAVCAGERAAYAWATATLADNDGAEIWTNSQCIARVDRRILAMERSLNDPAAIRPAAPLSFRRRDRAGVGTADAIAAF